MALAGLLFASTAQADEVTFECPNMMNPSTPWTGKTPKPGGDHYYYGTGDSGTGLYIIVNDTVTNPDGEWKMGLGHFGYEKAGTGEVELKSAKKTGMKLGNYLSCEYDLTFSNLKKKGKSGDTEVVSVDLSFYPEKHLSSCSLKGTSFTCKEG